MFVFWWKMDGRIYIAIDLKSFYASVECIDRGLDPLTTNLVVADKSRTEKTICLAVSPSLKVYGIPGRARLFEVVQKVREVNRQRQRSAPNGRLTGKSCFAPELKADKTLAVDYLVAPPRMAYYMEMSTRIYQVYLKYVAPEDMHVYSVDRVVCQNDFKKSRVRFFLKSFYASVECIDRELDPLTTNLVVADKRRTEKTICLAVSPSLKAYGFPAGRGCSRSCRRCARSTVRGRGVRRTAN